MSANFRKHNEALHEKSSHYLLNVPFPFCCVQNS